VVQTLQHAVGTARPLEPIRIDSRADRLSRTLEPKGLSEFGPASGAGCDRSPAE
jgi:hypothetical protein